MNEQKQTAVEAQVESRIEAAQDAETADVVDAGTAVIAAPYKILK